MASRNQQAVLCDICQQRPATVQVRVREDGRETTLNVCEQDYERLRAQEQRSPLGRDLFGGSLFEGFGDDFFDRFFEPSERRRRIPRWREREVVDINEYLSEQAQEVLQQAARHAVESGARNIDSEHLLTALADNDVVQAIQRIPRGDEAAGGGNCASVETAGRQRGRASWGFATGEGRPGSCLPRVTRPWAQLHWPRASPDWIGGGREPRERGLEPLRTDSASLAATNHPGGRTRG